VILKSIATTDGGRRRIPRSVKEKLVDVVIWQPLTKAHTIQVVTGCTMRRKLSRFETPERQSEAEMCILAGAGFKTGAAGATERTLKLDLFV
jgi:hypothetical protein